MATGKSSYKGLAWPLAGEIHHRQVTAATDIITLTAITAASGDFLVCETAGGGEVFVVGAAGEARAAGGVQIPSGQYLRFSSPPTTAPGSGLEKGDLFVTFSDTSTAAQLAVCVDTTNQSLMYIPFGTATFGRDTP